MKLTHMAQRNMWRNGGRTLLSASAIFLSSLIICFVIALESGFIEDMKSNITNHVTGDIRIMSADYIKNERINPLQFFIEDTAGVLGKLRENPMVSLATPKSDFGVSIYRGGEQIPTRAVGIDFNDSPIVNGRNNRLIAGRIPSPLSSEVLITTGLAEELGIRLDDAKNNRFTAITRTAISGSNGKTFTVSGILSMADTDFTTRVFFMDWHTAGSFLRMNGNALQIQVFLKTKGSETASAVSLSHDLSGRNLDIRPWYTISGLYQFFTMANLIYAFIGCMFYLLASTVVFNTTMMSVLERKKEIGTLNALGMDKRDLVSLFLLESGLIAAVGAFLGTLSGFIIVSIAGRIGFDLSTMGASSLKGLSVSRIIYPSLTVFQYLSILALGVLISLAACWFPAHMAASVEPSEALADR